MKLKDIIQLLKDNGHRKAALFLEGELGVEDRTAKRAKAFIKTHKVYVRHGSSVEDLLDNNRVMTQVEKAIESSDELYQSYPDVAKNKNVFMKMYIRAVINIFKSKGKKLRWSDYSQEWVMNKAEEYFVGIEKDEDPDKTEEFYKTYLMHMIVLSDGKTSSKNYEIEKGTVDWNYVRAARKMSEDLDAPFFAFIEAQIEGLADIGFTPTPKHMCTDAAKERWKQWYHRNVKINAGMSRSYIFKMKKRMFKQKYKEIIDGN